VEGDWKLILRYPGKDTTRYQNVHIWDTAPVRLFNLAEDPHGETDLAATHANVVERLKQRIENWHEMSRKRVEHKR